MHGELDFLNNDGYQSVSRRIEEINSYKIVRKNYFDYD